MFEKFLDYCTSFRDSLDRFKAKVNRSGALSSKENNSHLKHSKAIYEKKLKES
jgi:hypothetical protein